MKLPNLISQISQFSVLNASDSQVLGRSDSLSLPSEPPDIRNWFPNYQYESPKLDTNSIFGGSICEETEIGKEEFLISDSEREREESLKGLNELEKIDECDQHSIRENVDSSQSLSLLSEPLHLGNWFSNYVYESPALDTIDDISDSIYKESEHEDKNRENLKGYADFRSSRVGDRVEISDGLVNNYNSLNKVDTTSVEEKTIFLDKSNTCIGNALQHCSKYVVLRNHEINESEGDVKLNPDGDDSQCPRDFPNEVNIMPTSLRECSEESMHRSKITKDPEVKGFKEDCFSTLESKESARCGCDKENYGNKISNDGFVTTRRGRFRRGSEENYFMTPKKNNGKRGDLLAGREEFIIKRKVLVERTNVRNSSAIEITGKWKCPQKTKPSLGPPLKQLRLERWIQK